MKSWSYGINSLYKQASIYLEQAPLCVFAAERVAEFLCDLMPPIPLPNIKKRLKHRADIDINGGEEWTTWQEWYGDLSQVFHCFVHVPIFDFCQKRIKGKVLEIDYQRAKDMFYEEDKEFWDRETEM